MNDIKPTAITIDATNIQDLVNQTVEETIISAVEHLSQDPSWLDKIENMINQEVIARTMADLKTVDVSGAIKKHVDENMHIFRRDLVKQFLARTGIDDQATSTQLTVMDEHTVVENKLVANSIQAMDAVLTKDLVVTGTINVDNASWDVLANEISTKTLRQVDEQWKGQLVEQVRNQIQSQGIDFEQVRVGNDYLVNGNRLSSAISEIGPLKRLEVQGRDDNSRSLFVAGNRVGINTQEPESVLSIWDEEVQVTVNKYKNQEAYIGTARSQALNIGVNKDPQIQIGTDGITAIKKLRVAQYRIGHTAEVPNWSGTKGDVMFNANPSVENPVFAWVCLGGFQWKVVRTLS